ncbi:unnamed protein product [Hyaloperonospora brassicae]|uniref:Transcription elongation factor Eaf N-terminal domain-containing protein n=1 Tax=Hyaloperonospora brassicae TaxID=162125 RepID=A0AAV0UFI3_HYABA|nr:unnamed protein product [Hyaloperonospora brassicae]
MEANTQYALHDSEATPPVWAARVRLTPELLDKLRQEPAQVSLRLNVTKTDESSKTRDSKKKTSLLTVDLAGTEEHYELLSFSEDPGINHVCTFRRPVDKDHASGYTIYKTGEIHQKLLVQRLLDDTEKDRIKDKHAKSVLASKSRSSKMIDSKLGQKNGKRQTRTTRLLSASIPKFSTSAASGLKRRLLLPSALSKEDAKDAKEKIERGFMVEMEAQDKPVSQEQENKMSAGTVVNGQTTASARDADFHALFSSESCEEESDINSGSRVLKKQKTCEATRSKNDRAVAALNDIGLATDKSMSTTEDDVATGRDVDANAHHVELPKIESKCDATVNAVDASDGTQLSQAVDICAVKPVKPSSSGAEVKRARVRSALVSDRVKLARPPDVSSYPSVVEEICQRVARYHGRSAILDKSDYDLFVATHEQFWQDWEMLDKIYSIEMIKTEGLHLQLEVATEDAKCAELEARRQVSSKNKAVGTTHHYHSKLPMR